MYKYMIHLLSQVLTGIGRVGSRAIEEAGRACQVGHGCIAIAIHAGGHCAVAALLWCRAGHITVRRHAARVPTEA